jgi:hypothetical protein
LDLEALTITTPAEFGGIGGHRQQRSGSLQEYPFLKEVRVVPRLKEEL